MGDLDLVGETDPGLNVGETDPGRLAGETDPGLPDLGVEEA